jgi:ABC-type glutathione transport system ATPase component
VRGVDFDVTAGEVFGFLGPNGAGKSTTINMLCTLAKPSGGRASVAGYDVVTERDDVRRNIGLVFQNPTLDGYGTITSLRCGELPWRRQASGTSSSVSRSIATRSSPAAACCAMRA